MDVKASFSRLSTVRRRTNVYQRWNAAATCAAPATQDWWEMLPGSPCLKRIMTRSSGFPRRDGEPALLLLPFGEEG